MKYPPEVIERVTESNDIVELIGEYVRLEKRGKDFWGLCPFHSEKTPSFSVSAEKQMYYCFGCQAGGNNLSFLMDHAKLPFPEAMEHLAERSGVELPASVEDDHIIERRKLRERDIRIMKWASEVFHRQLKNDNLGRTAKVYLEKRGIKDEIIDELRLGLTLAGSTIYKRAQKEDISIDELVRVGLMGSSDNGPYDRFRNRLMFPIRDRRGRVIAFGGRVLDDTQPKYLNSPETPLFNKGRELYGLDRATKAIGHAGFAVIVEGYMDAIQAWQHGIDNVVASLGTALSSEQARIIKRHTDKVTLCYDADVAGQAATVRSMDILSKIGLEVNVARMGSGLDPDDFLRTKGRDSFLTLVKDDAQPLVLYKLDELAQQCDMDSPRGQGQFTGGAVLILAGLQNEVERQSYASLVISRYRLPEGPFLSELRKAMRGSGPADKVSISRHNTFDTLPKGQASGWVRAARILIRVMTEEAALREPIYRRWSEIGFAEKRHEVLAEWLLRDITSSMDARSTMHELAQELQSELAAAFNEDFLEENAHSMAKECFVKLEEHQLDRLSQQLLAEAQSTDDPQVRRDRMNRVQELKGKKKRLRERTVPSRGGIYLE